MIYVILRIGSDDAWENPWVRQEVIVPKGLLAERKSFDGQGRWVFTPDIDFNNFPARPSEVPGDPEKDRPYGFLSYGDKKNSVWVKMPVSGAESV